MDLVRCARFLPLLCICTLASGQEWTESEFLDKVVGQSAVARELRARVSIARAEAAGRGLYPNPSISYSREGAGFAEFYQAEQQLPLSGRLALLRRAGAIAVAAVEEEISSVLWQVRSDARLAFQRAVAARTRSERTRNAIADLRGIVQILTHRERLGEGSRFDRLRAERETVELDSEVSAAVAEETTAIAELRVLLPAGVELSGVKGNLRKPVLLPASTELTARALTLRSELRAMQRNMERFQTEQAAAERMKYPDPIVAAGMKRAAVAAGTETGSVIGVSVPIPLFNRGRAEVQRFAAEHDRAQARLDAIAQRIRAQVEGAHAVAETRRAAFERYVADTETRGAELIKIARAAYDEGELGILELLDAFRTARQAQVRAAELQVAWALAKVELDRAVGEEVLP